MTSDWINYLSSLGEAEESNRFKALISGISEPAVIDEDPDEYNDPIGKTKYYSFPKSGLEFGFRGGRLNHIHFYIQTHEGYQPFKETLIEGVGSDCREAEVFQVMGSPSKTGGGKPDKLLGYIHKWVKYEKGNYAIHFEFAQDETLRLVTLLRGSQQ